MTTRHYSMFWKNLECIIEGNNMSNTHGHCLKFYGDISEPFATKTGVRQGHRLLFLSLDKISSILFNIIKEKIMQTWKKVIKGNEGICLGPMRQGLKVEYLMFTEDLAFST